MTCVLAMTLSTILAGCQAREEPAAPGDAFGCVGTTKGKDLNCTEMDPATTRDERLAFATGCTNGVLQQRFPGRLVLHCREGAVARCSLPAEKITQLYSKDQAANSETMRGARIGCRIRGGTFEGPP